MWKRFVTVKTEWKAAIKEVNKKVKIKLKRKFM